MAIEVKDINEVATDLVKIVGEVATGLSEFDESYLRDNFILRLQKLVLTFKGKA
jgi:hypothetical protein